MGPYWFARDRNSVGKREAYLHIRQLRSILPLRALELVRPAGGTYAQDQVLNVVGRNCQLSRPRHSHVQLQSGPPGPAGPAGRPAARVIWRRDLGRGPSGRGRACRERPLLAIGMCLSSSWDVLAGRLECAAAGGGARAVRVGGRRLGRISAAQRGKQTELHIPPG